MKIELCSGSLRRDSLKTRLILLTRRLLSGLCETDVIDLNEYLFPLYHGDLHAQGIPELVIALSERIQQADALIISAPEYNASISGMLKNVIDWISRIRPQPWAYRQILLLSASPSYVGGNRGLWQTRVPFEICGAFVYPGMFALARAHAAFTEDGSLSDSDQQMQLTKLLLAFKDHVRKCA